MPRNLTRAYQRFSHQYLVKAPVKPMRSVFVASLFAASHAIGATSICPKLPVGSALKWVVTQGPDFAVCHGIDARTKEDKFGIYFGFAPNFHAQPSQQIGLSKVAGVQATWYRFLDPKQYGALGREALVTVEQGSSPLHIWLFANNEAELNQRLTVLEKLQFKK